VRACGGGAGGDAARGGVVGHQVSPPSAGGRCPSVVFGVCWLPLGDQLFNQSIPTLAALQASNQAMVTAIEGRIVPVWRHDLTYAVSIRTMDRVSVSGTDVSATAEYLHLGFRTPGPVGFLHPHRAEYAALAAQDRGDQYRLQSLKPYIDYAHSYPSPDGNVLKAKPLFCVAPRLRLFWLHPYVPTLFGGTFAPCNGSPAVTSTLVASILDPADPLPQPGGPGDVGPVTVSHVARPVGHAPLDVQLVSNLASRGDPCTGVGQGGIVPGGVQCEIGVARLEPLKLYLAVLRARLDQAEAEVYRFNFQTSLYDDFAAQVNSYRLHDGEGAYLRDAVFDDLSVQLDATGAARLAALLGNAYPPGDPLEQAYADPFDRLVNGILRLGPLPPPAGTEFNVVRNRADAKVIGIMVCGIEPLNDPRVPAAELAATLILSQPGTPASDFTTLHSRDRARAFVAHAGMDLQLHDLTFAFTYLEYDGAAYVPASTASVSLFPSPPAPVGAPSAGTFAASTAGATP
ncbi:MAG TPA: hypothetical protein VJT67_10905, partial [Longimicrobiaceae bacterium]|nr:hypothetical protein [Longimicrobiaceae bacterium]